MSETALAAYSGVSLPTVQRILSGRHAQASWANVVALAEAMGMSIEIRSNVDAEEMRERQARKKAEVLGKMVQGTSALEGQAVGRKIYEGMLRRSMHELLAGPARKLWGE